MISSKVLLAAAVAAGLAAVGPANATPLLTYGQTGTIDTVTASVNASDTITTISGTAIAGVVTQYLGGGAPFNANLTLNLVSAGPILNLAGVLTQAYTGTASWTLGPTNYLTASFTDALFSIAGSTTVAITASQPPGVITYTSSVLPAADFQNPLGLSFSFADVSPPSMVVGTTLGAFVATVSNTSSTNFVPEPATLAVLGVGLVGLAKVRRRRAG